MRELELLEKLASLLPSTDQRVIRGIGDDAMVLASCGAIAVSVDQTIEGVHADLSFFTHREFGARAVLSAMSDLSAMGALPGEALLALTLPIGTTEAQATELIAGAGEAATACGCSIVGGDLSIGPALAASVTVIGHAEAPRGLVGRDGAQSGDLIGLTGLIGGSGAGLALLSKDADHQSALADRHRRPAIRVTEGMALAAAGVTAMIDLSDGLAADAAQVGRASGLLLEIDSSLLPIEPGVEAVAEQVGMPGWQFAAGSGEDFELLFTAPSDQRLRVEAACTDCGVTWIGNVVVGEPGASIDGRRDIAGWEHTT